MLRTDLRRRGTRLMLIASRHMCCRFIVTAARLWCYSARLV